MVVIMTELHEAASVGDFVRVEEALNRSLDPNETDPEWDDRTPLHIAASKGYISSVSPVVCVNFVSVLDGQVQEVCVCAVASWSQCQCCHYSWLDTCSLCLRNWTGLSTIKPLTIILHTFSSCNILWRTR